MGLKERSAERRKRMVGNIAHSHEEAEDWDLRFWLSLSPQERVSAVMDIHDDISKAREIRRQEQG